MSDKFIVNKQNDISTLDASEWNQFAEINNFLVSAGITPDGSVLNQIAKGVANYSNASNFFIENGTVNNYTLIANNNFLAPTAYITGMVIRFITTNANTTTTPTVNLAGLGAKNIKKADGSSVIAGDINGYVELRYDGTQFLLSPLSSALNITSSNKGLTYLNQPITIANNTTDADNDIDFTAGNFQFDDNSGEALASAMTKRLDASWTAGTNQGGLDTGTKQANTWYHCYAIYNPTTQVSDFIFSANATNPTLPSGFTKYKYLGSVLTNVSGNIIAFRQTGNYFEWKSVVLDQSINPVSATRTNITISVPLGISCLAVIRAGVWANNAADFTLNLLSTYNDELIPIAGDGRTADSDIGSDNNYINTTNLLIQSNTSSQISYRASSGGAVSVPFTVRTKGYFNLSL